MSNEWMLKPGSVAINTKANNPKTKDHDFILYQILCFIVNKISPEVNYDHIITTIPRFAVPLKHKGRYYDISFRYKDRVYFVQIDSCELKEVEPEGDE